MSESVETSTNSQPRSAAAKLHAVLDELAARAVADGETTRPSQAQETAGPEASANDAKAEGKAGKEDGPKASLGALVEALDERAYGMMLLLLALPCCLPFVYLLPQIVALPMLALAAQMALGKEAPWLPAGLAKREFQVSMMKGTVSRAERYLGWVERITHPRLTALSDGVGMRITGALLLIPCASILVPLPLTNSTPGIGVAIASVGLIERDGLLIILGLLIGLLWVAALIFFGAEAISLAKDWIVGLVSS
ncbi:MAG: exopolysaccharide biosynthesis protein [Aquisalinus sp.]|nr:exopolysaccharide biosynthesis protein [Aquisalinus sp.]